MMALKLEAAAHIASQCGHTWHTSGSVAGSAGYVQWESKKSPLVF